MKYLFCAFACLGSFTLSCVHRNYNSSNNAGVQSAAGAATIESYVCRYEEPYLDAKNVGQKQSVELSFSIIRSGALKGQLFFDDTHTAVSVSPEKLPSGEDSFGTLLSDDRRSLRFNADGKFFLFGQNKDVTRTIELNEQTPVTSASSTDGQTISLKLYDEKSHSTVDSTAQCQKKTESVTLPLFSNFYQKFDRTQVEGNRFVYKTPNGFVYMETGFPVWYDLYKQYDNEVNFNKLTADDVAKQNLVAIEDLYSQDIEEVSGRVTAITPAQAEKVLAELSKNPVAGPAGYEKYDPDETRGFCFGRAAFVHLELIARGVNKRSIRKAFVVGPMKTGNISWQFHVATIVKGTKGEWLAIDPVTYTVRDLKSWYNNIFQYSTDKKLKLYIADANKFGPSAPKYNPVSFKDPFYNGYFVDLMEWFRKNRGVNKPEDISFL